MTLLVLLALAQIMALYYATDPPYIVDSNNNIVGRLTTNPTIYGGITYEELMIILTNNNQ